jgi:hypothetical protein
MRTALAIIIGAGAILSILALVIKYFRQPRQPLDRFTDNEDNDISVGDMVMLDGLEPDAQKDPTNIWWKGK